MDYKDQLKHPKWQKKRLEILERDDFTCQNCGDKDKTLNVHHYFYHKNHKVWEYENDELTTLCSYCHKDWHETKDNINTLLCVDNDRLNNIYDILELINYKTPFQLMQIRRIIEEINKLIKR